MLPKSLNKAAIIDTNIVIATPLGHQFAESSEQVVCQWCEVQPSKVPSSSEYLTLLLGFHSKIPPFCFVFEKGLLSLSLSLSLSLVL
jgi:hypothetical protein